MQCPIDQNELRIADRNGVEIDYCPKCRGVWLDREELDKILDRAAELGGSVAPYAPSESAAPFNREAYRDRGYYRRDDDDDDDNRDGHGDPRRRRRRSFLDNFFDFD